MLKLFLLGLGLVTLIALVWHVGPARLLDAVADLGPAALLVILLPSLLMYLLEAYGWRLTLGKSGAGISFPRLLAVRTAGEVVNMTTPTAYMGGEPLKAYLLKSRGVPLVEGFASVITAKTTMTIAEVAFILLGLGLAIGILGGAPGSRGIIVAASVTVGMLVLAMTVFLLAQHRGLFTGLLGLLRRLHLRIAFLEHREQKLRELDETIGHFYSRDRRAFTLSLLAFFLGWMAEALEVYAILYYLGVPIDPWSAIAIAALSVFIKGGTFFIPGSVGAQEGGNLLLLLAFGYTDVTGLAFSILRRLREVAWIAIGLGCLGGLGGRFAKTPQLDLSQR
ncbi:MAG: flippase-like domain-containing protein [Nitrospirales bacterium]